MKPVVKHVVSTGIVLLAGATVAFAVFVWSGIYDVAADEPHTAAVQALLTTLRERSMQTRAEKIAVPDLNDPAQVVKGAGNYAAMCVACHLAPGMDESEISKGLYPTPPNLSKEAVEPGHAFWAIKHGIKASGMPAWGKSMDEQSMWSLAAFLQKLPKLDAAQFHEMVERSGGHSHGGGESTESMHSHGEGASSHHDAGGEAHHDAAEGGHHAEAEPPSTHTAGHAAAASAPGGKVKTHTHADGKQHEHAPK